MTLSSLAVTWAIATVLGFAGPDDAPAPAPKAAASGENPANDPAEPEKSTTPEKPEAPPAKVKTERATFGGGCFWCLEAVFERLRGVKSVVSGYAGGTVARPSYELVCTGLTGHAEVIQIEYDPAVVTYEKLLDVFWMVHDPTTLNRQGPDFGTQYRSIILYHNEAQKLAALKSYRELTAAGVFSDPIVTDLVPMRAFYPADRHHQDYYRKNPNAWYCKIYIEPKLQKLMHK